MYSLYLFQMVLTNFGISLIFLVFDVKYIYTHSSEHKDYRIHIFLALK